MNIKIEVNGKPEPGGSKKAVPLKALAERVGRKLKGKRGAELWIPFSAIMSVIRVIDDNPKAKKWKAKVEKAAIDQLGIHPDPEQRMLLSEDLIVTVQFFLPRPKAHYKKDGSLSAEGLRNPKPLKKPDTLKLMRSTEDALTGVVWADDALISDQFIHKRYADDPQDVGAIIHVFPAAQFQYEITFRRAG